MVLFYAVVTCAQVRTLCLHCATGEAGTPPLPAVRSQSSLYPRHAAFERWGLWGRVDGDSWRCEKCSGRPLRMATKVGKAPGGNVTFFGYGFLVVPARRRGNFEQKRRKKDWKKQVAGWFLFQSPMGLKWIWESWLLNGAAVRRWLLHFLRLQGTVLIRPNCCPCSTKIPLRDA